ncbi:nucleotidyl transferase AbiEii/AbiGii toxin family protein [Mucilaginibacter sp. NFX135]|uniref:nucleotidyl transferase AbiEii/AbiGii toxin family protein n=1 Tax=Mucilaginibacter sp. NFX135 TaxID=3402687 RepID=UPI003AFB0A89
MLHKETVTPGTLELIHRLMDDEKLKKFYLVGGTALSLMLGHRLSIDIDLFTADNFNGLELAKHLNDNHQATILNARNNFLTGHISGVRLDMLLHNYPHVNPVLDPEGIRMLGLEDIAAMKINAIVGNGTRVKDFVDIHYLLKEMPYQQIVDAYSIKYPNTDSYQVRMSLLHHQDIDFTTEIRLIKDEFKWPIIEKSIKAAIAEHELILNKNIVRLQT